MTEPGAADGPPTPSPTIAAAALRGLCPRCGSASLFAGIARFAPRCPVCGLDFAQFNVGDGPAAFLTLILGTLLVGLAISLELAVQPPFWVHLVIWIPATIASTVASLRIAKAGLLAAEYRNNAREGRLQ